MARQSDLRFTFEPLRGDCSEVVSFTFDEGRSQPFKLELELASHNAAIDFNRGLDLSGLFTLQKASAQAKRIMFSLSVGDELYTCVRSVS